MSETNFAHVEVCNFQFLPLVYQQIGGLYVFLHDLATLQISHALQDLPLQYHVRFPMLQRSYTPTQSESLPPFHNSLQIKHN